MQNAGITVAKASPLPQRGHSAVGPSLSPKTESSGVSADSSFRSLELGSQLSNLPLIEIDEGSDINSNQRSHLYNQMNESTYDSQQPDRCLFSGLSASTHTSLSRDPVAQPQPYSPFEPQIKQKGIITSPKTQVWGSNTHTRHHSEHLKFMNDFLYENPTFQLDEDFLSSSSNQVGSEDMSGKLSNNPTTPVSLTSLASPPSLSDNMADSVTDSMIDDATDDTSDSINAFEIPTFGSPLDANSEPPLGLSSNDRGTTNFSQRKPPTLRSVSTGTKPTMIDPVSSAPLSSTLTQPISMDTPLLMVPPSTRPVLNRYYSTPMNPMSPSRQHFRLHNPVPHHVKETPTIKFLEDARGKFINQYQITRVVGRGSFGMVYLAVDPHGQQYALKECSKRRLAKLNRVALMRLRRQVVTRGTAGPTTGEINSLINKEIAVMKKLDHPNLVTLYEVLDDPNSESLILVLEWCPEGTIMPAEEDYDGNAQPICESRSRLYFRDLILGVEYLHSRGVCHRDIKADNVLLGEDDVVKIADFGVSEIFDLTKNGEDNVQRPVGSLAYMSPELVMLQCGTTLVKPATDDGVPTQVSTMNIKPNLHPAHAPISGRKADIWAMGVTLYYMVHGRLPFEASDVAGLHHSIVTTEPDLSKCSPDLANLFRKLFTKSPAERITLSEMREHPWVTQNGLDALLPHDENIQVSEHDRITEEDLRNAIDRIVHRPGAPRLDYLTVTRSLRANHGWHGGSGSTDASASTSGAHTPLQVYNGDDSISTTPYSSPDSVKMDKLSRALEELLKLRR